MFITLGRMCLKYKLKNFLNQKSERKWNRSKVRTIT